MKTFKPSALITIPAAAAMLLCSCGTDKMPTYTLKQSVEVTGRQGVCTEGDSYWVSGSKTLARYDKDWNLISLNENPFDGYEIEVNHIGDIDVYNNELYIGAEYFMDGVGTNIQVAIYDADTLKLKRTFPFVPESGQLECSGITVDTDTKTVWMCSWVGGDSGIHLYAYDLDTGAYKGKFLMNEAPLLIQGIAYNNGYIYITCDDGDADQDEPDHMYRTRISKANFRNMKNGIGTLEVTEVKAFDDATKQGEIEGLSFDKKSGDLLLLYNRGARIIEGMPSGFYEGYDHEISEVFVYKADFSV